MSNDKPFTEGAKPAKIKRRNTSDFSKIAEKTVGQALGFIGENDENQYMVKRQALRQNLADVVASKLGRFIFGEDFPKDTLLLSAYKLPKNEYKDERFRPDGSAIASKMIKPSENLGDYFGRTKPNKSIYSDAKDRAQDLLNLNGGRQAFAFNLLIGNTDFNFANFLLITDSKTQEPKVIPIDFGLAWQQSTNVIWQRSENKNRYEPRTPEDIVFSWKEGGHIRANSFLNHEFVAACNELISKIEQNPEELNKALQDVAHDIRKVEEHYKHPDKRGSEHNSYFNSVVDEVFPSDYPSNITMALKNNISDRVKLFKDFVINIEFQLAILEGNEPRIKELLEQNPKSYSEDLSMPYNRNVDYCEPVTSPLATRTIQWLPENHRDELYGARTYEQYIEGLPHRRQLDQKLDKQEQRDARVKDKVIDNIVKAPAAQNSDGEWVLKIDGRHKSSRIEKILDKEIGISARVTRPKEDQKHVTIEVGEHSYPLLEKFRLDKQNPQKEKGR